MKFRGWTAQAYSDEKGKTRFKGKLDKYSDYPDLSLGDVALADIAYKMC